MRAVLFLTVLHLATRGLAIYTPHEAPVYSASCSIRERSKLASCTAFSVLCRGYGGSVDSCASESRGEYRRVTGVCTCHNSSVVYDYEHIPRATGDGDVTCTVAGACGAPPTRSTLECREDVFRESCTSPEFTSCAEGEENRAYKGCIDEGADLDAKCLCVTHTYRCLRDTGCDELMIQQACDDKVDQFQAAGARPAVCNYLTLCRCSENRTTRLVPGMTAVIATVLIVMMW
eukprot:Sspe_Gene.76874::Locus_48016_Transcript_1_1_Confidence_1.000_Length_856::g.76874::m.76874